MFLSDELKPAHSKPKSDIYIVDEKWFNEKRIDVVYVPADRFGILGRFITKYMFDRESQKVHNQHEIQRKTSTKQKERFKKKSECRKKKRANQQKDKKKAGCTATPVA